MTRGSGKREHLCLSRSRDPWGPLAWKKTVVINWRDKMGSENEIVASIHFDILLYHNALLA